MTKTWLDDVSLLLETPFVFEVILAIKYCIYDEFHREMYIEMIILSFTNPFDALIVFGFYFYLCLWNF